MDINETSVDNSIVNTEQNTSLVSNKFSISSIISEAWNITKVKGVKSGILKSHIGNSLLLQLIQLGGTIIYCILCLIIGISTGIFDKIDFENLNFDDPNISTQTILIIIIASLPFIILTICTSLCQMAIPILIIKRSLNVIRTNTVDYSKLRKNIKNKFAFLVSIIIYSLPMIFIKIITTDEATGKPSLAELKQNIATLLIMLFFSFFLYFMPLIVCDKEYKKLKDVFSSVWYSVSRILKHIVTYIALTTFALIVVILSVVLLFIPFLWTWPFLINLWAVAYEKENF